MNKERSAGGLALDPSSSREAVLAMDSDMFRRLGHQLVDQVAEFLESLPQRPVTCDASPSAVREALDLTGPLPELGMDPAILLEQTAQRLFTHSLFNGHPVSSDISLRLRPRSEF
jgi:aromatic-L-amino-acid decarboxylase